MAPTEFVPNPADVKYLVDNEVPQIINDLVSAITTAQPNNVSLFAVNWINQQKSQLNLLDSKKVDITPFEGQKTGTSGLRKKVTVFQQPNYLQAWLQSLFRALCRTEPNFLGSTLVLGGDGRYFNELAAQTVIRMAFANGVKTLIVGQKGLMATPAVSAVIRKEGALGGIIMTASHNPGGPTEDWGIKYNCSNGEPAPEKLTDIIYEETKRIRHYVIKNFPIVDLTRLGTTRLPGGHVVHVISSHGIYLDLLKGIFDFPRVKHFCQKAEMKFVLDCMHGVGGVAATAFIEEMALGPKANTSLRNNIPKPDFGGLHPDPNLKYAAHLVDIMYSADGPSFGAAFDGDADRNMILGKKFFVTPSDSVAVVASYADKCIPYFRENGIKGLARSMPTATSLDRVALYLGVPLYEVPTGWKFFCNLMDANKVSICGEESFGTGAAHIREKDGLWAVIAWISILQYCNATPQRPFTGVQDIVERHWRQFGRSLYCRYDYEAITGPQGKPNPAEVMMDKLASQARGNVFKGQQFPGPRGSIYTVASSDIFEYHDPVDGSKAGNQGVRIFFTDTSRIIFRLSGTGSAGATVRIYFERYQPPGQVDPRLDAKDACKELAAIALKLSDLQDMTGRMSPTVIT